MPGKLITISYRLPYRISASNGKIKLSPSVGGLATALRSFFESGMEHFDSLHWMGIAELSKVQFGRAVRCGVIERDGIRMHPVFLTPASKDKFYDGFCNSTLWPLFLYFPSFVVYREDCFSEYIRANRLMADRILEVYEPGDTIWVHDYHWMLVPGMLREDLPGAKIGFFLHIPFPSFELYRLLPNRWRDRILDGLAGANVIGFQTRDFVNHFTECQHYLTPREIVESGKFRWNLRTTAIGSFPISIDYEKFNTASRLPDVRKNARRIRQRLAASKLVLSVDRLDYTKAISNRLESFALFLEQHPQWREKVTYILLLVPTREAILKYRENKLTVEALISRINGRFSTLGWTPIVYQHKSVAFKKLVALYVAADVALVTPLRDGMNLVAKEYVACRSASDGVLILSETAGAASYLKDAVLVNANDRQEIADAIAIAMKMPDGEQKNRIDKMRNQVRKNNVRVWATDFLRSVHEVAEPIQYEV